MIIERNKALLAIAVATLVKETLGHQPCGVDSYSRQDFLCDHYTNIAMNDDDYDHLQELDEETSMSLQVAAIMQSLYGMTTKEIQDELKNYLIEGDRYTSGNPIVQEALDMWING